MARMTIDRAVQILSEASRGVLTNDAEFKVACVMGKNALLYWMKEHDAEHSPISAGNSSSHEQKP